MAKLIDLSQQERQAPRVGGGGSPSPGSGPGQVRVMAGSSQVDESVAKGHQQMSKDITVGLQNLIRAQAVEEDRVNTLRAEDAYNKLREKQLDLSKGSENGFIKLKGADAVSTPILKEWGGRFENAEREIEATLSNDAQRAKFRGAAARARLQFNEDILRYQAAQGDAFAKQVYDGTVASAQRNAVARWDSPFDVASELARVRNAVDERAERYGWAPEYKHAELTKESSKIHAAVVQQAVATGQFRYAQKWYETYREDIDLSTARQLEKAVEDGTQRELQAKYNTQYLANENSRESLEALRQEVLGDGALGEDRRNVLVGRIQNRQYVLDRRDEVAEAARLRQVERGLASLNANTLAGFEPTAEQFAPVLDAAKGAELEGEARQAMALANQTRAFRNATPLQQERILAEAEAGIRAEPTKFDRRVVAAWRTIHESQQRQVKESPVTFAVQQGIIEPPMPIDLAVPEKQGPALAERFEIARGVSARYQAPLKPLTEQEVLVMKASLAKATVDQRRGWFSGLAQAAGDDYGGYSAVMAQLAPDNPALAVAGVYAYRGRTEAADAIIAGQAILHPARKEDGQPDKGKLWPMPPEADLRKAFQGYEGTTSAFGGRPEFRNSMWQASLAIYAKLSVDDSDASGVISSSRMDQAMRLATGGIEKYKGKAIVLPYGYEYGQFVDGLQSRINVLVESGRLAPELAQRARDLPLEPIGDGRYVFRAGDGVLATQPRPEKPGIKNADGSISTESTITVEADGRHFVIPTIVGGKRVSEDQAVALWRQGTNQPVGDFGTALEADQYARSRTERLSRELAPQPVIIDFNIGMPYRFSGQPPAAEPSAAELQQAAAPVTGRALPRHDRNRRLAAQ